MTLNALLEDLSRLGVRIHAQGPELAVNAPKGSLTGELRDRLRRHKGDLLEWLSQRPQNPEQDVLNVAHDPAGKWEPFPLSDLQSAFYVGQLEFMDHHVRPHYYTEIEWPSLDVGRYERAWQRTMERHLGSLSVLTPDLRLKPLATIPPLSMRVVDLRGERADVVAEHLAATRERMMRATLPLDHWPWLDWEITRYGRDRARIHFNGNSFFSDGPGTQALFEWVQRFYDDPERQAPPLEVTFRDCVLALERLAESPRGRAAREYWLSRLSSLPPPPSLPRCAEANPRRRSHLERRKLVIDAETWAAFKRNARATGLTPSNAVAALYAELLGVYANSRHFIINNMVTRRFPMHPQIREVLGNFASLYPLEIDLRQGGTFAERAARLQGQLLRDLDHLSWGGMQVLQALNRTLQAEPGRAPCPYVIGSGLFMASLDPDQFSCLETPQALLDHQFWELPDGRYFAVWDLIEDFFPHGFIDEMWDGYAAALRRLSADAPSWQGARLVGPSSATQGRRKAVNATGHATVRGLLHDALHRAAKLRPHHPAVIANGDVLSYAELHHRANRIGCKLRGCGVRPNELVAVVMGKGPSQIAAVLGVLESGAAYVPIDPSLPQERARYLLGNAQVTFALTDEAHRERIEWPVSVRVFSVDGADFDDVSDAPLEPCQCPEDLAYVIYTSGSTGEPKGVMIDHRSALNTILDVNRRFGIGAEDRIFGISSLSFDLSVYDVFGTIAAGATLVLPDGAATHAPLRWIEQLQRENVSVWNSVPALMQLMVDALPTGQVLPALRRVLLSGDWIPVTLPDRIRRAAPAAEVISLGGATEASIWSIFYPVGEVDPKWASIPYGRPLANQRFHVLDEDWQPCPDWVSGELFIAGDGLALGYWRDAEKTARSFVSHPESCERLYRTGDFGRYLPSGDIEFLGRRDSQVKIQGFRVELGEVEAHLLTHPHVAEAVVLVHEAQAQQGRRLAAYVVPDAAAPAPLTTPALRSHLAERVPSYMVPSSLAVIPSLPLTANGKVDRKALQTLEMGADASPRRGPAEFVAPRDDVERAIASIWEHVLGRAPIGVHDDFFDLGGQSFGAVRILARLDEQFGRMLPLSAMLAGRTIAALRELLCGPASSNAPWSPLVQISAAGAEAPCFLVHPAGGNVLCYRELAQRLDRPCYGLQAIGLDGKQPPREDVRVMATSYVEALRAVQPSGPYHIGGWSSGGTIAFEMARQLEAAGESLGPLLLIDSPAPVASEDVDDARLVLWFIEDLNEGLPAEQVAPAELRTVPEEERLGYLLQRLGGLPSGLTAKALAPVLAVFKAIVRSGRQYRPEPIDTDLIVLRARDGQVSEFRDHPAREDPSWGWSNLTRATVRSAVVPGTHHTLLVPPQLETLIRVLKELTAGELRVGLGRGVRNEGFSQGNVLP